MPGLLNDSVACLGLLAVALSVSMVWPQAWLTYRTGYTHGLSGTACWLALALNLSWFAYGIAVGDPAQVWVNVLIGAANLTVIVALLRARRRSRMSWSAWETAPGVILTLLLALIAGASHLDLVPASPASHALGTVALIASVGWNLVQPISLLRQRSRDASGVSRTRWVLSVLNHAVWIAYAVTNSLGPVWANSAFALICAGAVLYLTSPGRLRQRRGAKAPFERALGPTLSASPTSRA